ncbi:MAG: D-alanine--D-alanine ligase [Bacteroidales bacterium]
MQKNIAIATGGDSSEYVISVASASNIERSLDKNLYKSWIITMKGDKWIQGTHGNPGPVIDKNDFSFIFEGKKIQFDCVFMAIHGTPGEDGKLQAYFDLLGIPYTTCGVLTSAMTFNKYVCKGFLNNFGILSPKAMLIRKGYQFDPERIAAEIGLPCFIKPNSGGSSFGITRVKKTSGIKDAIHKAFREDSEVIVEEFIEGTELTGGVFKSRDREMLFPLTEIVSKNEFFDFDAKYNREADEITPARITGELTGECKKISSFIYDLLDCHGIVRMDYILANNRLYFLEANTVPGMTDTSIIPQQVESMGLDIKELFTMVIEDSIENSNRLKG